MDKIHAYEREIGGYLYERVGGRAVRRLAWGAVPAVVELAGGLHTGGRMAGSCAHCPAAPA